MAPFIRLVLLLEAVLFAFGSLSQWTEETTQMRAEHRGAQGPTQWFDAMGIGVGGRAFQNTGNATYFRLPISSQPNMPPYLWMWSTCSSGMFVQFYTNAATISVQYQLLNANTSVFSNFPPTGFSGADLHRYDISTGQWRWVATSFVGLEKAPTNGGMVNESPMLTNTSGWPVGVPSTGAILPNTYQYRLHFPSYNGVTSMAVGVGQGASLTPDHSWNYSEVPPVLYYGTSINQGGLSPRAGDTALNRLSRSLTPSLYNFGFCGACRMELSVAAVLTTVPASVFVIDCGHNMDPPTIRNNTIPFVTYVRGAIPAAVPIVLVEPTDFRPSWVLTDGVYNVTGRRAELKAAYATLVGSGVQNLHYVDGPSLYAGADSIEEELAFEGIHPLDRGHQILYEALLAVLKPLVQSSPLRRDDAWPAQQPLTQSAQADVSAIPSVADMKVDMDMVTGEPSAVQHAQLAPPAGVVFTDSGSLVIRGRAFDPSILPGPFTRLPSAAHGVVRDAVWSLSLDSAGIMVGFATDSPHIWINYTAADVFTPMVHFPVSGISGIDMWCYDDATGQYRFAAALNLPYGTNTVLMQLDPPGANMTRPNGALLRCVLYLPTYNQAVSVGIGVEQSARLVPDDPLPSASAAPPIVWYGTSILQGGVSFKVGNIFTSCVSRALNREVFNFGFSGNGKMEVDVAQYFAPVNASVFIIDCNWNMDADLITANAVPLVTYIRKVAGKGVPVVMVEGTPFGRNWAVPASNISQAEADGALLAAYQQLIAGGDTALHYVYSSQLFGPAATLDSGTANGLHPTDSGMHDVAEAWISILSSILG